MHNQSAITRALSGRLRSILVFASLLLFHVLPASAQIPVTGQDQPALSALDRMMTQFLQEHHVVGASLAVAKNGSLVYARGFGYADRDAQTPVQP
jgi:CubicO group peptidase (beta-lactamase class C family)